MVEETRIEGTGGGLFRTKYHVVEKRAFGGDRVVVTCTTRNGADKICKGLNHCDPETEHVVVEGEISGAGHAITS